MAHGKAKSTPTDATTKWMQNTVNAAKIWATNVNTYRNNYVSGLSSFFGQQVPEGNVHVQRYIGFAQNATAYQEKFITGVDDAAAQNRWYTKFAEAFLGTSATAGGTAAPATPHARRLF